MLRALHVRSPLVAGLSDDYAADLTCEQMEEDTSYWA
jgi:hypothetical protein